MKQSVSNEIRSSIIKDLFEYFSNKSEDCGMIASNSFNFPIVSNGEEGFVEIVVKIPKYDGDEGYSLREDYVMKQEEKTAKKAELERKKAEKIAKDKAIREAKAKAKAEK